MFGPNVQDSVIGRVRRIAKDYAIGRQIVEEHQHNNGEKNE